MPPYAVRLLLCECVHPFFFVSFCASFPFVSFLLGETCHGQCNDCVTKLLESPRLSHFIRTTQSIPSVARANRRARRRIGDPGATSRSSTGFYCFGRLLGRPWYCHACHQTKINGAVASRVRKGRRDGEGGQPGGPVVCASPPLRHWHR